MKAKSYGLTDLAQLQKDLKKQAEARAQAEKQAREQQALEQRMSSEFLNEVRGVTPIKPKDRYIHPTRHLPEPTVRVQHDHEEQMRDHAHVAAQVIADVAGVEHAMGVLTGGNCDGGHDVSSISCGSG